MPGDPTFGEKMAALNRERGTKPPGRRRIADKHGRVIDATERIFAEQMPVEAERYIAELEVKEPERCPVHQLVLCCSECGHRSERTTYDHRAAAYLFDRIMGKPTTRTETAITVRFVEHILEAVFIAFGAANDIPDPAGRAATFAAACQELAARTAGAQS